MEIRHARLPACKITRAVHKVLQELTPQTLPQCQLPAQSELLLSLQLLVVE